ncbi:hypothetical protein QL093DRAFT_1269315 [Fusarium oxysporum]|nr:hypothetical protein QL093DRAFT_1269315 [Fusarium oxysporum]
MDNLYSSAPEYMGNTISDINQQLLNGMGDGYGFEDFSYPLSSEDFINQFGFEASQDMFPSTVTEDAQLPVDPKLLSTVDTPAPYDLNSPSDMPKDLGAPKPSSATGPSSRAKTIFGAAARPVHQAMAQPNMPAVGHAASRRRSQSVDLAANVQLPLFGTHGQATCTFSPIIPSTTPINLVIITREMVSKGSTTLRVMAQYSASTSSRNQSSVYAQHNPSKQMRGLPSATLTLVHAFRRQLPRIVDHLNKEFSKYHAQEPDGRPAWLTDTS